MNVDPPRADKRRKLYDYRGEFKTIAQLSQLHGVPQQVIRGRLSRGWTAEEAAETTTTGMATWLARNGVKRAAQQAKEAAEEQDPPRLQAARKIAEQVICGKADLFDFRCVTPDLEYEFASDSLIYTIRFSGAADACTAQLTARYRADGEVSCLWRKYKIFKDNVMEVHTK